MEKNKYSVLMSVYQNEKPENLKAAMDSMWNQSIATNDFVLVCDGPLTPDLDLVIDEMVNLHRDVLSIIRIEKNCGLGNALNEGLRYCKNELVARMDSDDISKTNRCEIQLDTFQKHPNISICSGTVNEFFDNTGNIIGKRELPIYNEEIKVFSRKRNPFNHPAVMFRKSAVLEVGGYNEKYHLFEDYYLWVRMLMSGIEGTNVREPILDMRTSQDLYLRRGGRAYAKEMLRFHKWMLDNRWASIFDFVSGALIHAIICLMPNTIRKKIYESLHRKG